MPRKSRQPDRTANSTAQLALPGLESRTAPVAFDPFTFIHETFTQFAPCAAVPVIKVSKRMVRTLGSFTPTRNMIRLSGRLLALGSDAEQKQVVLHEVAHAIVHHREPSASAHGREFRSVCRELGLEPGRFVNIDHSEWRERTRFAVECPVCGSAVLRRKRARRVRCECGHALKPQSWSTVAVTDTGVRPL